METYTAINNADKRKNQKPLLLVIGLGLIATGIFSAELIVCVLGALMLLTAFYRKVIQADESGMTTYYDFVVYKTSVSYPFPEFTGFVVDIGLEETIMAFIRNGTTTYALFKPRDAERIVTLAQKANPRLKVNYSRIKANKRSL